MYRNSDQLSVASGQSTAVRRRTVFVLLIAVVSVIASGCGLRLDMQVQPRNKAYTESPFFTDRRGSRDMLVGTVARGQLNDHKAFYTGKIDNPDPNVQVASTVNAQGNNIVTSFPNDIDEFPVPVTKELIDRGQERYGIYCSVCHGPTGNGDGMIVRRGFSQPPTYHDDRLRNAPVGHFFDVISNGWGKMNGYGAAIQPADRWAIVAYIRAMQIGQNPDEILKMKNGNGQQVEPANPAAAPNANTHGGGK